MSDPELAGALLDLAAWLHRKGRRLHADAEFHAFMAWSAHVNGDALLRAARVRLAVSLKDRGDDAFEAAERAAARFRAMVT